jgi:hypothetical protein
MKALSSSPSTTKKRKKRERERKRVVIRVGALTTFLSYFQKLSKELSESLEEIAKFMVPLQSQIEFLAPVFL